MKVTITQLRQDLFKLVDRALEGEPVQFQYKGVSFSIVPETKPSKLQSLVRQTVVSPDASLDTSDLMKEMEAEWESDWSAL